MSKYSTISGNIGVNDPRGRLGVSPRARRGGKQIVADIVWVGSESQVLDVFANVLHVGARAVVGGTITQPIASPIYDPETLIVPDPFDPANLPPAFPITCGGPDLRGGFRETITLTPGVYGDVRIDKGGKLVLGPGTYNFCYLGAVRSGGIVVTAPATINVRDQLQIGSSSSFTPVGYPNAIQVNVEGPLARIGSSSTFNGRLFVPNGKLTIGRSGLVTGHLVARLQHADKGMSAFSCGDGAVDSGEQCDPSAPGGDGACPGMCGMLGATDECTCPFPPTTTTTVPATTTTTTTAIGTTSTTATTSTTIVIATTTTGTTTSTTLPVVTTSTTTTTTEPPTTTTGTTTSTTLPVLTTSTTATTTEPPTTTTGTTTSTTMTVATTSTTTSSQPSTTTSTTTSTTMTTVATTSTTTTAPPPTTTTQTTTSTTTTATGASTTTTTLPPCAPEPSSIGSNFNGTPIRKNNFIWFSSVFKVHGLPNSLANPVTIHVTGGTITFTAAGTPYTIPVPDGTVVISPSASTATITFDVGTGTWQTTAPPNLSGNAFLTGVTFQAPVDLPGGIDLVTWGADFSASAAGVSINWQWAAAVYTTFSANETVLGVKPVDDNQASIYQNSDHAGTPENFKGFVTGGARGGGGSNFTGSYSGTGGVTCP